MPQSNSDPQSASNRHWGFSTAGRVFFGWGVLEELRTVGKASVRELETSQHREVSQTYVVTEPLRRGLEQTASDVALGARTLQAPWLD